MNTTEKLAGLVFDTHRIVKERIKAGSKLRAESLLQMEALHFIASSPEVTMKDVAGHLCVTPPSATSLVSSLVKSGFVERVSDERDRRIVRLVLTSSGQQQLMKSMGVMKRSLSQIFDHLNEGEKKNLVKILEKLSQVSKKSHE